MVTERSGFSPAKKWGWLNPAVEPASLRHILFANREEDTIQYAAARQGWLLPPSRTGPPREQRARASDPPLLPELPISVPFAGDAGFSHSHRLCTEGGQGRGAAGTSLLRMAGSRRARCLRSANGQRHVER